MTPISPLTGLWPTSRAIVLPDHHRPYIGPQNTLKRGPKKDPKRVILDHPRPESVLGSWVPRVKPWILGLWVPRLYEISYDFSFKSWDRPPRIMNSEGPKP